VANGANFDAEIRLDISPFIASMQRAQSEVAKLSGQIDAINKKTITVRTNVVSPTSGVTATGTGSSARMAASRQELAMQRELDAKAKQSAKEQSAAVAKLDREKQAAQKAELRRQEAINKAHSQAIGEDQRRTAANEKKKQQAFAVTQRQNERAAAAAKREAASAASQQQRAAQQAERNLSRERYALYDVAASYTIIATAAGAAVRALATTAIDYERSFSNVQRTTENFFTSAQIGEAANVAKEELKSLASEIPVAFGQITEIATIGNQLGIAQGAIGSFSETVAKFSAATGVSVESTAMSFGRIGELLNVPASQFENLGSSIAFAGVNAVATEEQILSVTKEIATTAKMAKFTTPEIVGLSTALSSLGIAPEAARGSIIRTFAGINKAISENGQALQQYSSIAGMSAEEFASTWQTNGQLAFGNLLKGLQGLSDEGQNLDTVLRNLGMVNVRDIQTVQKLGDNYSVYTSSIEDANKGFQEGAFLGEAYAVIQDTVAAKLALVSNNISNLLDTLGQTAVGDVFKSILDAVNDLLVRLNQFAKSPVGQAFGAIVVVAGTLVTVIAAINAASALAQASLRAFATAQVALIGPTEAAAASVAKVNGQLVATGAASSTAALGLQKGKIAMGALNTVFNAAKVLVAITIITTALEKLGQAFTTSAQKAENLLGSFGGLQDALSADYAAALTEYGTEAAIGLAIASEEIKGQTVDLESNNEALRDAAQLQEGLAIIAGGALTNGIESATDEVRAQNIVLGENFNAWVASSIASSEAFQGFAMNRSAMNALKEIGFNLQDAIDVAANGGSVVDYVRQLGTEAERAGKLSSGAAIELAKLLSMSNVPLFGNPLGDFANAIEGSVDQASILGAILPKVGDDIGDAAEEAEELERGFKGAGRALRTVVDYANDLRTVFSRAIEITFGQQQALDQIASGWANIADKADKATSAIADANAEIKELTADRSVLEYQLTVAERYGDEQRAAIIRAKIAKLDKNIVDETQKKSEAEAELTKTTEGNSASAIENRKVLTDMVGDYASLIEMYSKTGMKGKELKARITELRKEFRQQALDAGYSREEIAPYVKMFGEFKTIVDKTPRNVDVEFKANVSAANQALKEFIAKINNSSGTVTINTNYTGSPPVSAPSPTPQTTSGSNFESRGTSSNPYTTGIMPGMSIPSGTRTLSVPLGSYVQMPKGLYMHGINLSGNNALLRYGIEKNNINGKAVAISGKLTRVQADFAGNLNSLTKFADGGLVSGSGSGVSDSIPAMLSNGEFVIKASAVGAYGIDFLNALNQQKVGSFTSNSSSVNNMGGSTVAHLSPEDRALLRAVIDRPVNLYTENAKIASSANAGNVVLAQRGTN
jgi:TP901 family phage tail tape measure protein